jgi:hypothetical protein
MFTEDEKKQISQVMRQVMDDMRSPKPKFTIVTSGGSTETDSEEVFNRFCSSQKEKE